MMRRHNRGEGEKRIAVALDILAVILAILAAQPVGTALAGAGHAGSIAASRTR